MDLLSEFNRQVLRYQDDAYTLAWYLSGCDEQAEAITQAAVAAAYPCFIAGSADCRLVLLEQVIAQAHDFFPRNYSMDRDFSQFEFLNESERQSLALVDVLGLNYQDAAYVARCSLADMSRSVAQARRKHNQSRIEENATVSA